jgi:hypothetical protein
VASSSTGRWVRRVGSSGGGRTYRRRRPINYYGVLAVICVLGVSSVALARYQYRHPASAAPQTPPTTSDVWFTALGINACGVQQPALAANPSAGILGFQAQSGGVVRVAPLTAAQTGTNATLARFVAAYRGLQVTKQELVLPPTGKSRKPTIYKTGTACPAGTKDAGKVGHVEIAHWKNLTVLTATTTTSTSNVRFSPNMLVTIAFVPSGTTPPKPPGTAVSAMLAAVSQSPNTTTTLFATTTTLPGSTTTLPATTTTSRR